MDGNVRAFLSLLIVAIIAAAAQSFQRAFRPPSLSISAVIGVVAGAYAFFKGILDVNKLILENKIRYEVQELKRAEQESGSVVKLATAEEQQQSPAVVERKLRAYWEVQAERDINRVD